VGVAAMGQYYSLPNWGYAGHTDSNVMDEQAAADSVFSVMIALLVGANLVHDVGYIEAGLTTSPEMMVFTDEIIAMMRHFAAGVRLDAEALAMEVIHRVGPAGNYLTDEHTVAHFRELWRPTLFDRQRADDWHASGSKRLGDRLRDKAMAIMENHQPEPLPDPIREEIRYILQ
jgi:trimethylamine--corrinoid protein Co-methyltransferase